MYSDSESHANDELSSDSAPDDLNPVSSSRPPRHSYPTNRHPRRSIGSGMFSGAQQFTVTAQNLTNVTNNYSNTLDLPSDFRMIPLGDIGLLREIRAHNPSDSVGRLQDYGRVRRMYTAKVDGHGSNMTVAVYQGMGAEKEWRRDISNYMAFRHPNLIQIRGGASCGGIHATFFHDDFMSLKDFFDLCRPSPIMIAYLLISGFTAVKDADDYLYCIFHKFMTSDSDVWVHPATGRLTVDPILTIEPTYGPTFGSVIPLARITSLDAPDTEDIIIDSWTLAQYHEIYGSVIDSKFLHISILSTVNLGGIISRKPWGKELEDYKEIASLPCVKGHWYSGWHWGKSEGTVTENGWTRFDSRNSSQSGIYLRVKYRHHEYWLSQANHIFSSLQVPSSSFENYVFVDDIGFYIVVSSTTEDPPSGYLFLCPAKHFQTGASSFAWPDSPAYWSLDPSGTEHLSVEDATDLRFPFLRFSTETRAKRWNNSVYAGLHQFHRGKGFDPDSQDVARHLGHPLYQLSSKRNIPFAHIDEIFSPEPDDESQCGTGRTSSDATQEELSNENEVLELTSVERDQGDVNHPKDTLSQTFELLIKVQLALILVLALWEFAQSGVGRQLMQIIF